MQFPSEPVNGAPITASWGKAVVRCLRAIAITSIVNGRFSRTANGTSLVCSPPGRNGETLTRPLLVVAAPTEDEPRRVRVVYGTIGGVAAEEMSPGDADPAYHVLTGDEGLIWADITVSEGGAVSSWEIASGPTLPDDSGKLQAYKELASFTVENAGEENELLAIASNLTGSQDYRRCRDWYADEPTYSHEFGVI